MLHLPNIAKMDIDYDVVLYNLCFILCKQEIVVIAIQIDGC